MAEVVSRRSIIYDVLFNTKKGTKQIKNAEKSVKKLDDTTGNFNKTLAKVGGAIAGAFAIQKLAAFTKEAVVLAERMRGIRRAFEGLNKPDLLINLRNATRGTVTDLELMRRAVQAKNFKIPLDQLAKLFDFASRRARETGESVDFLVNSIVSGIGRKSPLILDNLGISAVRLRQELKGVGTDSATVGDVASAVAAIIDEELGGAVEIVANNLEQFNTALENVQTTLGEQISSGDGTLAFFIRTFTKTLTDLADATERESLRIKRSIIANIFSIDVTESDVLGQSVNVALDEATDKFALLAEEIDDFKGRPVELAARWNALNFIMTQFNARNLSGEAIEKLKSLGITFQNVDERVKETSAALLLMAKGRIQDTAVPAIENLNSKLLTTEELLGKVEKGAESMAEVFRAAFKNLAEDALPQVPDEILDESEIDDDIAKQREREEKLRAERQQTLDESLLGFDALSQASFDFIQQAAGDSLALSQLRIFTGLASALAQGVASAQTVGFPANLVAIASTIAAITSVIAQAKQAQGQAESVGFSGFAEGTDFLSLSGSKKGKDTIPIWADEGEAIIKADSNKAYPGLARAFIDRNVEDWIGLNYNLPKLETIAGDSELIDYSNRFYNQLRATKSSNLFLRDIRDAVMNKNDTRAMKLMNRRRF